ncbi:MAG: GHMP kinase [Actinomycetota bacterium]|nr:GHMP kinase [Actinomycetota bacterium]
MKSFSVAVPGSCGELLQGCLDGRDFHVSCPVDIFSRATAFFDGGRPRFNNLRPKARLGAMAALRSAEFRLPNLRVELESDLEPGKGMASSTADIAAAAAAVTLASGRQPREDELARLAVAIEPTDGTLFHGIVGFDHKEGASLTRLGTAPALKVSYIDTGGSVDTIEFNRSKKRYTPSQLKAIRFAYEMIVAGFKWRDWRLVGMASTLSARVNQEILPKPALEELIEIAASVGGYGVVVAHSGTVAGIVHDRRDAHVTGAIADMGVAPPATATIINGGWRLCLS